MVQATNSLPQSTPDTFQPVSASAVHILARLAAKNAVKQQMRDAGIRLTLVLPAEINAKAHKYLSAHPELYQQALERARRMGLFEKPKRQRKSAVLVTLRVNDR
jgi:hypothetical protein